MPVTLEVDPGPRCPCEYCRRLVLTARARAMRTLGLPHAWAPGSAPYVHRATRHVLETGGALHDTRTGRMSGLPAEPHAKRNASARKWPNEVEWWKRLAGY